MSDLLAHSDDTSSLLRYDTYSLDAGEHTDRPQDKLSPENVQDQDRFAVVRELHGLYETPYFKRHLTMPAIEATFKDEPILFKITGYDSDFPHIKIQYAPSMTQEHPITLRVWGAYIDKALKTFICSRFDTSDTKDVPPLTDDEWELISTTLTKAHEWMSEQIPKTYNTPRLPTLRTLGAKASRLLQAHV